MCTLRCLVAVKASVIVEELLVQFRRLITNHLSPPHASVFACRRNTRAPTAASTAPRRAGANFKPTDKVELRQRKADDALVHSSCSTRTTSANRELEKLAPVGATSCGGRRMPQVLGGRVCPGDGCRRCMPPVSLPPASRSSNASEHAAQDGKG